ncbi:MAG: hypothetical protein IT335_01625 [Thermomicrobiales bacterium]|nr:hypothetical protein [Thermomicrobiales bacterium]
MPEPIQVENPNSNRMIVPLGAGLNVECAFFVMPVDAQGDVSAPGDGPVIDQLPNTGSGSMIGEHSGLSIVALLAGTGVLLAGVGLLATREDLFER